MQTQDPKGAPAVLGGPGYPKSICDLHGTPEVSRPGPGPGSLPSAVEGDWGHWPVTPVLLCWAGWVPCGRSRCFTGKGMSQQSQRSLPSCALLQDAGRNFAGADPWLQHSSPRFRGTQKQLRWCCHQGSCPPSGVPSTPQPQPDPHSDLTCFSSIIHILESPGRNYRKLRLFQTLSARQVKSSHTKQGNQNLQH